MVKISLFHVQTSGQERKRPQQDPFPWPKSWWGKAIQGAVILSIGYGILLAMVRMRPFFDEMWRY